MNYRLTLITAAAVILASVSLYPLLQGTDWFWAGTGAVLVVAAAGTATRLPALPAGAIATAVTLIVAMPLLASPAWYWKLLGLALVICAACSVTRLRLLPVVAGALTYLAALLIYLNQLFAGPESVARIVPTTASLRHLWTLAGQGINERIYAPPVPGAHGAILLAAAGIGLMAIAADVMAVRLRSPAIAGLPLLALFSVPITTSAKQGAAGATITFCLGIAGYLWLLAADGRERLRIWGRLVTLWQSGRTDDEAVRGPDTRALAASGRRIGLAAISLAIFIPLLLPGLRVHNLFGGHGGAGGSGGTHIPLPDPVVRLQNLLLHGGQATVLTYHTNNPAPQQQYLQVYVLNYVSETSTWEVQTPLPNTQVGDTPLPAAPGLSGLTPGHTSTTRIDVSPGVTGFDSRVNFLPLPYVPETVHVLGSWGVDLDTLMVLSASARLSGLHYRVKAEDVEPTVQQLDRPAAVPHSISAKYLSFPSPARRRLQTLANKIITDAGASTAYQKAVALEKWFTSGIFKYNVHATDPDTPDGLVTFLTRTKQGYCQQFAFGMAALARIAGIPSRVVVGYTAGTRQPDGKTWKVTTADAHAWPQLYFQGSGWLRFEPTPGGADGQGTAIQPAYAQNTSSTGPGATVPGQTGQATSPGVNPAAKAPSGLSQKLSHLAGLGAREAEKPGGSVPVVPIAVAVLVLAAAVPRTARSLARRWRWHAARGDGALAHAAWLELHHDLADYGIGWRVSESPRAVSRRLAATLQLDAGSQQALDRVSRAEERARYAKVAMTPESLRADVTVIRRAVAARAGRLARWRAWLLPPSALVPVRSGLQHALDVFGWLDAAGLRVRGRVRQLGRES